MVYLLDMVIFHGELLNNQMVISCAWAGFHLMFRYSVEPLLLGLCVAWSSCMVHGWWSSFLIPELNVLINDQSKDWVYIHIIIYIYVHSNWVYIYNPTVDHGTYGQPWMYPHIPYPQWLTHDSWLTPMTFTSYLADLQVTSLTVAEGNFYAMIPRIPFPSFQWGMKSF